ncbi:MAG: hypothetical protein ACOYLL_11690 [Beijerinckiaceae bacterium]
MITRRACLSGFAGAILSLDGLCAEPQRTRLVAMRHSAFPYDGMMPGGSTPFLDSRQHGQWGHTSSRGGFNTQASTYSDKRSLLHVPKAFNPRKPACLVVFFHGNRARLEPDVIKRQRVPVQLDASKLNGALIAPQLAVNVNDSSAGHFWTPDFFARYIAEAEHHLAKQTGHPEKALAALPIVIVAYSGGYYPTIFSLEQGGATQRIKGVVLLDALFGEGERFADWITEHHKRVFFASAYSAASKAENLALKAYLTRKALRFPAWPVRLTKGTVCFIDATKAVHDDFVSQAWVDDPLAQILGRIVLPF